ncbi:MAG: maleylpyruvate isomerase family mycothiol-dependent enzyme [Terriglobia bacterium]
MKRPGPIFVLELFPAMRRELLTLLSKLSAREWERPTACALWSVKDVALHLLGGDIGILSRRRDGFTLSEKPGASYQELVAWINHLNTVWVEATRRLSPRVLCDLLRFTGPQVEEFFASLDPLAPGVPVAWAGPEPAPVWLDLAREYTERWHHQQQIRDAVGKPGLQQRRFFAPVLDTFVRALPHTFRDVPATEGTTVELSLQGESGGNWFLVRERSAWNLFLEAGSGVSAKVVLSQEDAWRLFTKGLSPQEARSRAAMEGDQKLGARVLQMVSVIA